ncbi:MAG: glycogen debranching protein [Oscillatoriales cyanobacterium RM2_1_1]|nr:glycogen debranching protein [Oscillatoriales cyanobacterium SM2_3_0]NJO45401.1 glycogen debranching protein [Oscillatoriales cyanobacterium RM2_1_1]
MLNFGRAICSNLSSSEALEWLVTNGIGGYAAGTVAEILERRYHGLLVAALEPPLGRTLTLVKLDTAVRYNRQYFPIYTNRWVDGKVTPEGFKHLEEFGLEGTIPTWRFACADAILEKRIWMKQGENTTYIQYHLQRATQPMDLSIKALVNYRDYHHNTYGRDWPTEVELMEGGACIKVFPEATPLYLLSQGAAVNLSLPTYRWHYGFDLATERYRGLDDSEDHLHGVTFEARLEPGRSLTLIASTAPQQDQDGDAALVSYRAHESQLLHQAPLNQTQTPGWIQQLILAANQFIVDRPTVSHPDGKTIIAGYPWFGDWGRDTMISLPGLTLCTGQFEVARSILRTFAEYVDQGMLPNRFPDAGDIPDYNTIDATLWYFEAIRAYVQVTGDFALLQELFPVLAEIIDWHRRGTRYNIHLDPEDGLISGGESGIQLTWMDAKVGNWVVTPRQGKPIEVNALWYHSLQIMAQFAQDLGFPATEYQELAEKTAQGFGRFWNEANGYCDDVLDSPSGNDSALRPNQLFAISLPPFQGRPYAPLLNPEQQYRVMEVCGRELLTSHGLRSLSPNHPAYKGIYGGDLRQRDGAYHQGTVWGWLIGPFVLAHLRVYQKPHEARSFLMPMAHHLNAHGVGSLSEIFDGDVPMTPRGCPAQAWTVAEVLRTWSILNQVEQDMS